MESGPPSAAFDWREHWQQLRADAVAPRPLPPGGRLAFVRYGLAQPFLGLRLILRSQDLLGISLAPALGVMALAGFVGWSAGSEHGVWRGLVAFLAAVAALAPLPSVIFGQVYAHMAAKARVHLGLPEHQPYVRGIVQLAGEWVAQVIVLALGVLPLLGLIRFVPLVGAGLVLVFQGLWALHWIVVEGYDNSRTLPPGRTVAELEAQGHARPGQPWFHRWYGMIESPRVLVAILSPFRMLSEVVVSLSRPWRREVDLVEERPWVSLGFGLGVAAMLAVPGLNLLFRPAVVVAGVHLRYRLLGEGDAAAAQSGGTQPHPAVPRDGTQPYSVVPPGTS